MKRSIAVCLCLAAMAALSFSFIYAPVTGAPPKPKLSTPVITCGDSQEGSIEINVCAGATGAPAGFSLQWMTCVDYAANGNAWYASDDPRLCKASFSGNASGSNYNLAPGACITVTIGDLLFDNGASTNCAEALECDTCYVFHAFAHATNTQLRSDFSGNLQCSTAPCGQCCGSLSQGYWRNHSSAGPRDQDGNLILPNDTAAIINANGGCLTLGDCAGARCYSPDEVAAILLSKGTKGNILPQLEHQVIAVKLSILAFDGSCVDEQLLACLDYAESLIGCLDTLNGDTLSEDANGTVSATIDCLDAWIQAHDCDEDPTP